MKVIQKIVELQNELFSYRKNNKTIGLVPTMGGVACWACFTCETKRQGE